MFRHPVTGQPLGHTEQVLGTLVVTAVEPGAATGRLVPAVGRAAPAPVPGDGARITAGRLPVAVLPTSGVQAAFDSADQTQLLLVARFSALLEKTGRFLAVDPQRVLDLVEPDARIERLTPRGGAPARRGGRAQLPAGPRGDDPRPRDRRGSPDRPARRSRPPASPLVPTSFPPRFAWEETPELERRYPLDGPVRALALGDLDGDGRAELVVADEQNLTAYRTVEGGSPVAVEGQTFRAGGPDPVGRRRPADGSGPDPAGRRRPARRGSHGGARAGAGVERVRRIPGALRDGRPLPAGRPRGDRELAPRAGRRARTSPSSRRSAASSGTASASGTASRLRVPRGVSVYGLALIRSDREPRPGRSWRSRTTTG